MSFNLQNFRSALVADGARPSLFRIEMPFPAIASAGANVQERLSLMAHATDLPGYDNGVVTMYFYGEPIKVPGNKEFDDWTITIINDEDFMLRNVFEKWSGRILSHGVNVRDPAALNSAGYSVDAEVVQFSKTGEDNVLKRYKFIGVWPRRVSPIPVSWEEVNRVEEFQVTFAYQWYEDSDGFLTNSQG